MSGRAHDVPHHVVARDDRVAFRGATTFRGAFRTTRSIAASRRRVEWMGNTDVGILGVRSVADAARRATDPPHRFVVPAAAELSIEHEVDGEQEELELQLRCPR
jgi:hypothetical protein